MEKNLLGNIFMTSKLTVFPDSDHTGPQNRRSSYHQGTDLHVFSTLSSLCAPSYTFREASNVAIFFTTFHVPFCGTWAKPTLLYIHGSRDSISDQSSRMKACH